ncbi:MAG: SRPBCC family protein [Solirubrobacterales bacterium]|nr:SRPBCC family protein [Solirubrobacterales bacterium]
MRLEQSFEVQAPLQTVWEALIDVERVAPCLPGASVTSRNEDGSYNGEFKVKIGPTSAAYSGKLSMENVDEATHSATMQANGTDKRGQGGAKATIASSVSEGSGGATTVDVATDYSITGRLARFGRGGMIEQISGRLLREFAANLQQMLAGDGAAPAAAAESATPEPAQTAAAEPAEPAQTAAAEPAASAAAPSASEVPDVAPQPAPAGSSSAPATPTPPPAEPAPTIPPPSSSGSEPLDGLALVRSLIVARAKGAAVPLGAAVIGLLIALGVLRRRG